MEVNSFEFKKEVIQLLNSNDNRWKDPSLFNKLTGLQSFLKKEDSTHIFFSKRLADEYIFSLLSSEPTKPAKRFQRKSKNPPLEISQFNEIVDLKIFDNSLFSNQTALSKLENFERTMQTTKMLSKKGEQDAKSKKAQQALFTRNTVENEDEGCNLKKKRTEM